MSRISKFRETECGLVVARSLGEGRGQERRGGDRRGGEGTGEEGRECGVTRNGYGVSLGG